MTDDVFTLIQNEEQREREMIGLIPSENHISPEVSEVLSSCLSSKYSEGYPGKRYYEGNQIIDELENLAIQRMEELFGVPFANVQPYSGSPANSAILFALTEPGDTIMGLKLGSGGHLTHGHPDVTFSGKYFNSIQYGLDQNGRIDFNRMAELAEEHKPKLIIAGTTSYPYTLDFSAFRKIADISGAWLVADISHIAGLVVGDQHPSPVPHCDVIMTTTHKSLRGPRGAVILATQRGMDRDPGIGKKINSAIIPGMQGGPHNATTAAIAVAAKEAMRPEFGEYTRQVMKNARILAQTLRESGINLVGGGTDNHLMVIDLTSLSDGLGTQAAYAMDIAGMYANRNAIPNEPCSPFYPSGIRIGTPLVTTRGMKEKEMEQIGKWIARVVEIVKDETLPKEKKERSRFIRDFRKRINTNPDLLAIRDEVKRMAEQFPLFQW
ncbi:MAG: serine hydroxymethyltransferase [Spirochaetia bacterium]